MDLLRIAVVGMVVAVGLFVSIAWAWTHYQLPGPGDILAIGIGLMCGIVGMGTGLAVNGLWERVGR